MDKLTDEQIVELITQGDSDSYTELVRRYEERLHRYISYLTQDSHNTPDILQDTFIKAYKNLNSFNTDLKFSSWIYRIAHNESINRIKKNNREIFNIDFDYLEEVTPKEESPEEKFERDEIRKGLMAAMEKLPLKFREVLTLHYLEDRPYDEISDILRVSIGTIGTWINRGKTRLRKILKDMNQNPY